jgi:hypothetical protein
MTAETSLRPCNASKIDTPEHDATTATKANGPANRNRCADGPAPEPVRLACR